MALPTLDLRVNWRNDGEIPFNFVGNPELDNTTGWSTAAGIASAATSITSTTAEAYIGISSATVVTTATNGSGVKYDFGARQFTSGRTYRFRIAAKSVSGTTAAKMIIGSLGTPADRATLTMTLTTSWQVFEVEWTPSANRTDVEITFGNNAAATMTARLDSVEVFETIDDITSRCTFMTYTRGASFNGVNEAPGQCTLRLSNGDGRFSPDNASSPLTGLLKSGRRIWARGTYAGVAYGLFYGTIRRIVPRPRERMIELVCEDGLYYLSRQAVSVALSLERSIVDFRAAILGPLDIAYGLSHGIEDEIVYTEADQRNALDLLAELNVATGTVHVMRPSASSLIKGFYLTWDRATIQGQAVDETFNDDLEDLANYDYTDEDLVNSQRVFATARRVADLPEVVWEGDVPFTIDTNTTVWAGSGGQRGFGRETVRFFGSQTQEVQFTDPTFEQTLTVTGGAGLTSTTFTPFSRSAMIELTVSAPTEITELFITGRPARRLSDQSVLVEDLSQVPERYAGSDISSDFIASVPMAEGLAAYWVYRYKAGVTRPDVTVLNRFPSQLQRDVADRIALTFALLGLTTKQFLIRSLTTTIDPEAQEWRTTYNLESTPAALNLFTIGGTADQGIGGTAVLGY